MTRREYCHYQHDSIIIEYKCEIGIAMEMEDDTVVKISSAAKKNKKKKLYSVIFMTKNNYCVNSISQLKLFI